MAAMILSPPQCSKVLDTTSLQNFQWPTHIINYSHNTQLAVTHYCPNPHVKIHTFNYQPNTTRINLHKLYTGLFVSLIVSAGLIVFPHFIFIMPFWSSPLSRSPANIQMILIPSLHKNLPPRTVSLLKQPP